MLEILVVSLEYTIKWLYLMPYIKCILDGLKFKWQNSQK
jgi:hypothetical protein